jgi:hypothetical protein
MADGVTCGSQEPDTSARQGRLRVGIALALAAGALSLVVACTGEAPDQSRGAAEDPLLGYVGQGETFEICTPRTTSPFLVAPVHIFGHPSWTADPPSGTVITIDGIDSSDVRARVAGLHLLQFDSRILVPSDSGQFTYPPLAFPLDSYDGTLRSSSLTVTPPEALSVEPLPADVELDPETTYSVVAVLELRDEQAEGPIRFEVSGMGYTTSDGSFTLPVDATTTIRDRCS